MNVSTIAVHIEHEPYRPLQILDNNRTISSIYPVGVAICTSYILARVLQSHHTWVHVLTNFFIVCYLHDPKASSTWLNRCLLYFATATTFVIAALSVLLWAVSYVQKGPRGCANFNNVEKVLQPRLLPCRTTHRRLIPTRHSFSYSYLFVGVPVQWRGKAGAMLSTQNSGEDSSAWFSVNCEDYLHRGSHLKGLQGKLEDYLRREGVEPGCYPQAYLVTAPRFLGFSFNPVSFWYLYDLEGRLSAMILEVNNTFDERRPYFLPRDTAENALSKARFTQQWQKDFHVSPFNDRDGTYSVTVKDFRDDGIIDNTIVLRSTEGKAKIVARIFSTDPAIIPESMSVLERLVFIINWGWVGFMTNPRIIREARFLWFKKLQVFYRPEPLISNMGRTATTEETQIEHCFRTILDKLSKKAGVAVTYEAAAGADCGKPFTLGISAQQTSQKLLTIKVFSPAFYSELVRSQTSLLETLFHWSQRVGSQAKLLHICQPEVLHTLFEAVTETSKHHNHAASRRAGPISALKLQDFRVLFSNQPTTGRKKCDSVDRTPDLSEFVQVYATETQRRELATSTARIWLADRIALGSTAVLKFYTKTLRYICVGMCTHFMVKWYIK